MVDRFLHFFEELRQPQLHVQCVIILERAVCSLKAIICRGEPNLEPLKPIPKLRIYLGFLDIFHHYCQLPIESVVGLAEALHIPELPWGCCKL